jgi:hypothetical protein
MRVIVNLSDAEKARLAAARQTTAKAVVSVRNFTALMLRKAARVVDPAPAQ